MGDSADQENKPFGDGPLLGGIIGSLNLDRLNRSTVDASSGETRATEKVPPLPPSPQTMDRLKRFVESYTKKSGTATHSDPSVTEGVLLGLGSHIESLGRPLCPCRYYADKEEEVKHRTWVCACDDMQVYKYCHCLLFTNEEGLPITEHLPPDHPGRRTWGIVNDPHPELGRPLRHLADERERERRERKS
jgi:ferredoxin-thioredoxin reductase catalytic chain